MKKLYWMLMLFLMSIPYAMGMEEKELTVNEARDLFWNSVEKVNNFDIPYAEYRANLMRAIPYLNFIQDYTHDPLSIAVKARDYDFVQFLLEHGADPNFRDMSQRTAMQVLEEKGGLYLGPDLGNQVISAYNDRRLREKIRPLLKAKLIEISAA